MAWPNYLQGGAFAAVVPEGLAVFWVFQSDTVVGSATTCEGFLRQVQVALALEAVGPADRAQWTWAMKAGR